MFLHLTSGVIWGYLLLLLGLPTHTATTGPLPGSDMHVTSLHAG